MPKPKLAFSQVSPWTPKEPMTLEAMLRLLRMVWRRHGWLRHRQEPAKWRRPPPGVCRWALDKAPCRRRPKHKAGAQLCCCGKIAASTAPKT